MVLGVTKKKWLELGTESHLFYVFITFVNKWVICSQAGTRCLRRRGGFTIVFFFLNFRRFYSRGPFKAPPGRPPIFPPHQPRGTTGKRDKDEVIINAAPPVRSSSPFTAPPLGRGPPSLPSSSLLFDLDTPSPSHSRPCSRVDLFSKRSIEPPVLAPRGAPSLPFSPESPAPSRPPKRHQQQHPHRRACIPSLRYICSACTPFRLFSASNPRLCAANPPS